MAERKPNILFYCTDQQRADLMGCAGHPIIQTPNLDALAENGVRLENCHVQGPLCMPSRASIMTSLYPSRHGVMENGFNLDEDLPVMGQLFADAGYHTGAVGRTHVRCSCPHPVHPKKDYYGFQDCTHSQCYWEGLDPKGEYLQWIREKHPDRYEEAATPQPVNREDAFCASWSTLEDDLTMTAWVTDCAVDWVRSHRENHSEKPFFLWAGTWDPHFRFIAPPPFDKMYDPASIPLPAYREGEFDEKPPFFQGSALSRESDENFDFDRYIQNTLSIYYGMISHIDDQFGRLLKGLEEMGELDNTIVVFTSDHGEMAGNHRVWAKGPWFFDDALRVPCIMSAPKILPARQVKDALVEEIDLLPTLMDLCDIERPLTFQGKSFAPLVKGEADTHRDSVFTEYQAINTVGEQFASIRTDRYRITVYGGQEYGELYDLQEDPDSLNNRWNDPAFATIRQDLTTRLLHRMMENTRRDPSLQEAKW